MREVTGVNVNMTTNKNVTPLMVDCYEGHENVVRRLSQVAGIEYNWRDLAGSTAVHVAVHQGFSTHGSRPYHVIS